MKFRFKALQRMREPDELDAPVVLAAPRGWVTVRVILIIFVGAASWALYGDLPRTLSSSGLLTHPLGVSTVRSSHAGMLRDVAVAPGDAVVSGQSLGSVVDPNGSVRDISSTFTGKVVDVLVGAGQAVPLGAPVLTVERTDGPNDRLVALVFVPAELAVTVRPGATVGLAVATAPTAVFGLLRGRVASVGRYQLSAAALAELLGGERAAQHYLTGPPQRLVVVDLEPDSSTPSGYAWTSLRGTPGTLESQTRVVATISLGTQSPASFLLGR